MGSGRWMSSTYVNRTESKRSRGEDMFAYSATVHKTGVYEVNDRLDPKKVAGDASPFAGKVMRESCDSDEHPESLPIAVFFDVTGSMHGIPRVLQQKLPKLYGMLLEKGYVEHPQILFGAIGDANSDKIPLQIGQFESDNRADEDLEAIVLEGGGGGGNHESYELAAYFMARHTALDSITKRGKKGYLFFIGDERLYSSVRSDHVQRLIGDTLQENIPTPSIFDELKAKYEVYYLFALEGSYTPERVVHKSADEHGALGWATLLGQNAIILDDADAVCETIALTIGLQEGVIDMDAGLDHLRELGTGKETTEAVGKALATVGATAVTIAEGAIPSAEGDDEIDRI